MRNSCPLNMNYLHILEMFTEHLRWQHITLKAADIKRSPKTLMLKKSFIFMGSMEKQWDAFSFWIKK